MLVVAIHAAFVEVDGGVPATGTLTAIYEVEAAQTSSAVLAVQFSYSPLGLDRNNRQENKTLNSFTFLFDKT